MLAVARALGHSSTDTTQAYVALPEEALRALMEAAALSHGAEHAMPRDGIEQAGGNDLAAAGGNGAAERGRRSEDSADVLLAALLLAWSMTDGIRGGSRSFRIDAASLAVQWGLGKEQGRRSVVVQTAAKRLEALGVIDLASGGDEVVCCFASMSFQQAHQYFSAVWADGFPRSRHHAVSDVR